MIALAGALALGAAVPSTAQTVTAELSSDEALVGETLTLKVSVTNAARSGALNVPPTDDFDIRPSGQPPMQSSQIMIVNGQMTRQETVTYVYEVVPKRTGTLTLPSFSIREGGKVYRSAPIRVRVRKDQGGERMFSRIVVGPQRIYVGQAVPVRLEIWVRPFRQQYVELALRDMWSLLDRTATSLGVFLRVENPTGREDRREGAAGATEDFYVYELETTLYPSRPGPLEIGDVVIAYNYPVTLTRDIFGRYQLDRVRRLRHRPAPPDQQVQPLPEEGRPVDFNGAVGTYSVSATAKPTAVEVGDPITLTLKVRGDGSLERISAPRLERVEALTKDFEIAGQSPAGEIIGESKNFALTIRPLRENVTRIPPIPFSYFDPDRGAFQTAYSEPIPIRVTPARRVAVANPAPVVLGGAGQLAPLEELTQGLLANVVDPAQVLADHGATVGLATKGLLAALPLAYLAAAALRRRALRFRSDPALRRRARAYANARRALRADASPAHLRGALVGYVGDRCNVPSQGLTRADAVRLVCERNVPPELTREMDALLEELELAEYAGTSAATNHETSARILRLLDGMERCRF